MRSSSTPRSPSPTAADPVEEVEEAGPAAAPARRFRRPARAEGAPRDRARSRPAPEPGRRSPAARRPAGARQDHDGLHRRRRDGRASSTSPRARRWSGPATSPPSSPSSTRATCCSSTRSIACRGRSRRSCTRRWRTSSSTSWSARARRRRSIRLTLPRFTLVGATTRTGMITGPLRDRFGLVARLDYYDDDELESIVTRAAGIFGDRHRRPKGAWEIARRSRGTPADRQPAAAPGSRLRRGPRRRLDRRRHGTRRAHGVRRRRARARQGRPGDPRRRSASSSAAARSG